MVLSFWLITLDSYFSFWTLVVIEYLDFCFGDGPVFTQYLFLSFFQLIVANGRFCSVFVIKDVIMNVFCDSLCEGRKDFSRILFFYHSVIPEDGSQKLRNNSKVSMTNTFFRRCKYLCNCIKRKGTKKVRFIEWLYEKLSSSKVSLYALCTHSSDKTYMRRLLEIT